MRRPLSLTRDCWWLANSVAISIFVTYVLQVSQRMLHWAKMVYFPTQQVRKGAW